MKLAPRKPAKVSVVVIDDDDEAPPPQRPPKKKAILFAKAPKKAAPAPKRKQSFFTPLAQFPVIVEKSEVRDNDMYALQTYSVALGAKFKVFNGYEIREVSPERLGVSVIDLADSDAEEKQDHYREIGFRLIRVSEDRYIIGQPVDFEKYPRMTARKLNMLLGWYR